jgi:hypothetical protein
MPFGLNKQVVTIAARAGGGAPPLWVESVETALLGRAQVERIRDGLELTMFGRPDVVAKRIHTALKSALGDAWEAALEIRGAAGKPYPAPSAGAGVGE